MHTVEWAADHKAGGQAPVFDLPGQLPSAPAADVQVRLGGTPRGDTVEETSAGGFACKGALFFYAPHRPPQPAPSSIVTTPRVARARHSPGAFASG